MVLNSDLYKENEEIQEIQEVFNILFEAIIENKPLELDKEPQIIIDEEGKKIIYNMFHFFILLNNNRNLKQQKLQLIKDVYIKKSDELDNYFKKKLKDKKEQERLIKEEEMKAIENRKEKEFQKAKEAKKDCKVCMAEVMTHGLGHRNSKTKTLSCHYCVCEGCATHLQTTRSKCPICRGTIDFIIKVFD